MLCVNTNFPNCGKHYKNFNLPFQTIRAITQSCHYRNCTAIQWLALQLPGFEALTSNIPQLRSGLPLDAYPLANITMTIYQSQLYNISVVRRSRNHVYIRFC